MKRGLVWFTEDLRLDDNETLLKAMQENDEILPVYVFHAQEEKFLDIPRMGFHRKNYILESVGQLKENLQEIGGDLWVKSGDVTREIISLCREYSVQKVYTKKQVGIEEKKRQNELKQGLLAIGVDFETYSTSTLFHPDDLPFSVRDIPLLFTKFRKAAEKDSNVRLPFNALTAIRVPDQKCQDIELPKVTISSHWTGGERCALERLHHYIWETQSIVTYKETRDQLSGMDFSSKFSAGLSQGCISPRRIYSEVKRFEREILSNESTYWLIFELLWRDFFRFSMKKYPRSYFLREGLGMEAPSYNHDPRVFQNWTEGKTTEPLVNAGMIELRETGFVSNRMRQILASYWIYGLKQDWRYGAAWFEHCLIDYDVSSNWGNWAYIAGVGNDKRGGREFNLQKQTQLYDKEGKYQRRWIELKNPASNLQINPS